MNEQVKPALIHQKIQHMKQAAEALAKDVEALPALSKNLQRILVSIKMLELNVSDVCELEAETDEGE